MVDQKVPWGKQFRGPAGLGGKLRGKHVAMDGHLGEQKLGSTVILGSM